MNKGQIESFAAEYVLRSEANYVSADDAIAPKLAGTQLFETPLVGYSCTDDPMYLKMKEPGVIGEHFRLPREWLEDGKAVQRCLRILPEMRRLRKEMSRGRDLREKRQASASLRNVSEADDEKVFAQIRLRKVSGGSALRIQKSNGKKTVSPSGTEQTQQAGRPKMPNSTMPMTSVIII